MGDRCSISNQTANAYDCLGAGDRGVKPSLVPLLCQHECTLRKKKAIGIKDGESLNARAKQFCSGMSSKKVGKRSVSQPARHTAVLKRQEASQGTRANEHSREKAWACSWEPQCGKR